MFKRCPHRAVAFVQYAGAATPACLMHAARGRAVEAITRVRQCCFDAEPSTAPASTFELVIAEAAARCACGASATLCTCCARDERVLRPLARAARREPLARQA